MKYRRCGHSGVLLPEISLGLWHNFGADSDRAESVALIGRAMELGICHFDLADNYGPPPVPRSAASATCCGTSLPPTEMRCSSPPRRGI